MASTISMAEMSRPFTLPMLQSNHLKQFKDPSSLETFDAKSGSSCGASTKAEEYVKRKVKDLKEEMTTKFMKVDAENNLGAGKTVPVPELIRQLDVVDKKLETFDNLLEKLYNIEEAEADFEVYEAWKREFSVKVTDLRGKLEHFNVPQATTKDKNSFMSVIKTRDPPKFDGDHLQYLESYPIMSTPLLTPLLLFPTNGQSQLMKYW